MQATEYLTVRRCSSDGALCSTITDCRSDVGSCSVTVDGYFIVTGLFAITGAFTMVLRAYTFLEPRAYPHLVLRTCQHLVLLDHPILGTPCSSIFGTPCLPILVLCALPIPVLRSHTHGDCFCRWRLFVPLFSSCRARQRRAGKSACDHHMGYPYLGILSPIFIDGCLAPPTPYHPFCEHKLDISNISYLILWTWLRHVNHRISLINSKIHLL